MSKIAIAFQAGIGDWMVYDSFWARQPDRIYWASRARPSLQPLIELVHPHVEHVNLWGDRTEEAETYAEHGAATRPDIPDDAEDWTVNIGFFRCRNALHYRGSSFLRKHLGDIGHLGLPERYVACQHDTPFNAADMRNARRLEGPEWEWIFRKTDLPVVVLGSGDSLRPPDHPRVIDLCGETSLAESIEVLKGSAGYYGIDSWLSILACQLHTADRLGIKYHGSWYRTNRDLYCAPHKVQSFIHRPLGRPADPYPDGVTVLATKTIVFDGGTVPPWGAVRMPRGLADEFQRHGMVEEWDGKRKGLEEAADALRRIGMEGRIDTALAGPEPAEKGRRKAR